eukprot:gnl/MRDRNA2_/MRDRNA2_21147_c0_seq2.p1 gnl/MRDRNA2_/MRDRNA2_21147_c0~~gnl/MRDRNA2_/MRDRNA2_21147_c0_seq2.p1  ORF type:complete len:280 (+),score=46.54 gnl/MRDRNA2_/MRDRNA2_21147_c0_seq2:153-992(+)
MIPPAIGLRGSSTPPLPNKWAFLLPLLAAFVALLTLCITWSMSDLGGCPPISFTALDGTSARVVYMTGCVISALLISGTAVQLRLHLEHLCRHEWQGHNCLGFFFTLHWVKRVVLASLWGVATAVVVQGVIPLQADAFDALVHKLTPVESSSMIHEGAEAIFFACSLAHAASMVYVNYAVETPYVTPCSRYPKQMTLILMIFAQLGIPFLLRWFGFERDLPAEAMFNINGVLQRLAVLQIICFLATYALDFQHCRRGSSAVSAPARVALVERQDSQAQQ